jgi:hypothetical protein
MRASLRVAVILVIFSGQALAAPTGKKGAPKHPVETMDSNDPAAKELSAKKEEESKPDTEAISKQQEAHLDASQVAESRAADKLGVFGNVLVGFGRAPEAGPGANVESGKTTSVTFMAGGHYDISPELSLGARLPWTVGSQQQIDGTYATKTALGSLELMGVYRKTLTPFTRLPILFGLGVPTAEGGYDTGYQKTRINEVADAASGYRDGELFGVKRLPIILGVGIDYERKALNLHAATKFVLGVKVGGKFPVTNDPAGTFELKSVTFRNVTSAGIAYRFLDKPNLFGALDSWVVYNAIQPVEFTSSGGASGPTRFQVVFEPRVGARFGKLSPSVGYIFPIGGRLADSSASGLELHCDVAF